MFFGDGRVENHCGMESSKVRMDCCLLFGAWGIEVAQRSNLPGTSAPNLPPGRRCCTSGRRTSPWRTHLPLPITAPALGLAAGVPFWPDLEGLTFGVYGSKGKRMRKKRETEGGCGSWVDERCCGLRDRVNDDGRCTINPGENEALVRYALDTYKFLTLASQQPKVGGPGIVGSWELPNKTYTEEWLTEQEAELVQRFDPSSSADTIGFFIAKFEVGQKEE